MLSVLRKLSSSPSRIPRWGGVAVRFADPLLDVEAAGIIGVWLETVGEVAGDEARRLDRLLDVHAEDQMIEQDLQHALRLQIAARRAERHQELALAHGHRRIGR